MIKWPEPALITEIRYSGIAVNKMVTENLYTEAQLKQAVRDALKEAVGLCDDDNTANAIRALIKEIDACVK